MTASTGNHALGFARALEIAKCNGTIYLPENASKAKIQAIGNYDVDLQFYGNDCLSTELYAKEKAKELNRIWVSPYNDPQIIAGQGTIGIELMEQLDNFDYTFINVGGGGLISGVGTYLKKKKPETRIICCQPENAPEMVLSLEAGKIVSLDVFKETLSDASAGGIEDQSITFPICQSVIDESVLVSEQQIAEAIRFVAHKHHKIIEGSAAVSVACLIKEKEKLKGCTVVIIICGSNIDIFKFKHLI